MKIIELMTLNEGLVYCMADKIIKFHRRSDGTSTLVYFGHKDWIYVVELPCEIRARIKNADD